jgi:hypothetical protein
MNEQIHFAMQKGKRDSDRLVEECYIGLAGLLHGTYVQIDGNGYLIKVLAHEGKVMFDIKNLPGFDHVEFVITKTGWGKQLNEPTDGGGS